MWNAKRRLIKGYRTMEAEQVRHPRKRWWVWDDDEEDLSWRQRRSRNVKGLT